MYDNRRKKRPTTPAIIYKAIFRPKSDNGALPVEVDVSARSEQKAIDLAWKEMEILFKMARYSWVLDSLTATGETELY